MRVLIVSDAAAEGDPLGAAALGEALSANGVETELQVAPSGFAAGARLAVRAAGAAARGRFDAALVFDAPSTRAAGPALAATRTPVVLLVGPDSGGGGLLPAARAARALVTLDPETPSRLAREAGIRGAQRLGGGELDLDAVPLGTQAEARARIGLEPTQRLCALTGRLDRPTRVDLLALAHRRVAGLGLLVIGTGDQDPLVAALSAATRPSSPVLHIPTLDLEARAIAVQAADVALALHPVELEEDALLAAASGRVVVALAHLGRDRLRALYPNEGALIEVADATPEALGAGLRAGLERARRPLDPAAVAAARSALGRGRPVDQLLEVLRACASSS